jgi:glycerol-3-phosphate acyltransferase PlsX
MRIAVDAMGGDLAPREVVAGAVLAARQGLALTLVGPRRAIDAELARDRHAHQLDLTVVETDDVVMMHEPASVVLRQKRRASVRVAAEVVARGDADGMFSAGHTGATVLAAHAVFGMLPGAERPALAVPIPTVAGTSILLDAGANVECRPIHLVHFAAMGTVFVRVALGMRHPRVALLSIGEEETKGNDLTREAHRLLKATSLPFVGNLEAQALFTGEADVVVCDGFTGNVALKVSEGLVDAFGRLLQAEVAHTFPAQADDPRARAALRRFRRRVDYSAYGGTPLLGVAGLCLVGHGRSTARAVRNAIVLTARYAERGILDGLRRELAETAPVTPA